MFRTLIILILLFYFGACDNSQQNAPSSAPPESISSLDNKPELKWLLENHKDKIAHYDPERNIFQIKVLDQTKIGSRQCGYHAVRNLFYLSAIGLAILKQDSKLINELYDELHDVKKFQSFVSELANIKGCPLEYYHQSFPTKEELTEVYKKVPESFPSSFSLEDIIFYGEQRRNDFSYFKDPVPVEEYPGRVLNFINEYSKELGVNIDLSTNQKKLFLYNTKITDEDEIKIAQERLDKKPMTFEINLQGTPGHGVAASAFTDKADNLFILFADSWHDMSIKTGWSKSTVSMLYDLLKHSDEILNRVLIKNADSMYIGKYQLLGEQNPKNKSLKEILDILSKDDAKKSEVLKTLNGQKIEFEKQVKKYELDKATLYPKIMEIIKKLEEKLTSLK